MIRHIFILFTLALSCLISNPVLAQLDDASDLVLSMQEIERLRKILNQPVDPNSLKSTKSEKYRERLMASHLLGDKVMTGQLLYEWLAFEPLGDAKWRLVEWLWDQGRRDEATATINELIQERREPTQNVRLRALAAYLNIQENNLAKAAMQVAQAEATIQYEFNRLSRSGSMPFWIARAELEFFLAKSELESAQGKWTKAIDTSKLALSKGKDLFRMTNLVSNEDHRSFGRRVVLMSQGQLGMRQTNAGLYADAEWTYRDAFKMVKQFGFNENQLTVLYDRVADLYNASGQFTDALLFAQKSERILVAQNIAPTTTRWIQTQLRVNTALAGEEKWQLLLEKMDALDVAIQDKNLSDIASQPEIRALALIKIKRHTDALALLDPHFKHQSIHLGADHFLSTLTRGLIATAMWQNNQIDPARQMFDEVVKQFNAPQSTTGDFAETSIQRKIKRFILQSYMQLLAKSATTQTQDAQALFQIADQIGTSSVQQALTEAAVRAGVKVTGLSDIIRKEQDARNELATLNFYIGNQQSLPADKRNPQAVEQMRVRKFELEKARKEYKSQIQQSYPEYFQLLQPKSPSHREIAQQLKEDELFISILPTEDQTYVWAIDAKGNLQFHNASLTERDMLSTVTRIRQTLDVAELGPRAPRFGFADSYRIYKELLSPLEKSLAGKSHLIIATSGPLAQLPLAVLTRSETSANEEVKANWLIKDFAISHVPTANGWLSLKKLGQQPSSTQALMAWGDPIFDAKIKPIAPASQSTSVRSSAMLRSVDTTLRTVLDPDSYVTYSKLPALPETRQEVLELAKIMSADPVHDVILGANATRQSVLQSNASGTLGMKQVVVFATHGLLAGDLPNLNQPALAMAATSNPNESPLLTLEDVLSLKLNADWVVLSACNTAGADGKAEEALSGLARGFFFAGSRSLLVTHWSVESESAVQLTTHTFAAYQKSPTVRRAEALRQAMLETMKVPKYAHPTFWAPYALVGEGGR
jgi:CHAT domain-containing protein